jgi:hypothetical protein
MREKQTHFRCLGKTRLKFGVAIKASGTNAASERTSTHSFSALLNLESYGADLRASSRQKSTGFQNPRFETGRDVIKQHFADTALSGNPGGVSR